MTVRLKPYHEYKDSGLPWLGNIPAHWDTCRLKYLLREVNVRSFDGAERLLSVSQYTGITPRRSREGLDEPKTRAESLVGYKQVLPNDLVVNIMLAWNGSLGISQFDGIVSPAYCVYRLRGISEPGYYHHLLRSPIYKARIRTASTGVVESRLRLYSDALFRIEALIPSKQEQSTIASFVEVFNRKVDRLIRTKRRLIELLKEQKAAIINRAVIRGFEPDVSMKVSEIKGLAEIPTHWKMTKLSRMCASIRDGTHAPPPAVPGIHRLLSARNIMDGEFVLRDDDRTMTPVDFAVLEKSYTVRQGDVAMATVGATTGKSAIVGDVQNVSVQRSIAILRPDPRRLLSKYLNYWLMSAFIQSQIRMIMEKYAAQPGIYLDDIAALKIPSIDVSEQLSIISWIRSETTGIASAITKAEREISLIKEYRTRLIADIVTGKLDVRGIELLALEEDDIPALLDEETGNDVLEEAGELEMIKAGTDADN